ncbi:MAG: hypothetical protein V4544_06135 [Pseudomonadota bacterium]
MLFFIKFIRFCLFAFSCCVIEGGSLNAMTIDDEESQHFQPNSYSIEMTENSTTADIYSVDTHRDLESDKNCLSNKQNSNCAGLLPIGVWLGTTFEAFYACKDAIVYPEQVLRDTLWITAPYILPFGVHCWDLVYSTNTVPYYNDKRRKMVVEAAYLVVAFLCAWRVCNNIVKNANDPKYETNIQINELTSQIAGYAENCIT